MAPQRFLITGGTGFIGQHLCSRLLAQGHQLTLLVRDLEKAQRQIAVNSQSSIHLKTFETLDATDAFDVVINLAGAPVLGPRWSAARKKVLLASRVGVTAALGRWLASALHKPRLMLSASAIGYYGLQSEDDASGLNEQSAPQPIFMSQLCQQWEQAARDACGAQVPLAILRLAVVLGNNGALPKMVLPFRFGLGGKIGSGRQTISWIHIDDVLDSMLLLIGKAEPVAIAGVYNFSSPAPVTQQQFASSIAKLLKRPALWPTPAWLLRLVLGQQSMLLLSGQRVSPQRLEQLGHRFRFASIDAALQDLLR